MTALTVTQALENIYASLENNNHDIDTHIDALKAALAPTGTKTATVDALRLVQNNRQGRKLMQSYFKKRGVLVEFTGVN
jgi:Skp family chaperone for outer membrane proteins